MEHPYTPLTVLSGRSTRPWKLKEHHQSSLAIELFLASERHVDRILEGEFSRNFSIDS
jgi:hypothetical protein